MKDTGTGAPDTAAVGTAHAAGATPAPAIPRRKALLVLAGVVGLAAAWQLRNRMAAADREAAPLVLHPRPRELPPLRFADGTGTATNLSAFRGRVVLLNVWATWCPPCVKEMPTLDRLQAALGGPEFEVVALSIDEAGAAAVQPFFARLGIAHLHPYVDTFGESSSNLVAAGIPLTLLIDRDGREIARKLGPAEWDQPAMVQSIREHLRSPAAAPAQGAGA
ncbi:TlpA family protein disulfide reductase [Piscinibacter sp.]|uniref:TlpA family protein disulfide reductase n=1 Tax=Piscinibacter sp. TaxID=1903157 RepID=UPI002C6EFD5E|nr:TlpA disulfide reductase family protein [Albitalea sp.]HUG25395.1 TlpA disulfide reductase family protein [Albitalea sp.]